MKKTFFLFRHGLATRSTDGYGDQILTAEILPEAIPPIEALAHYLQELKIDPSMNFSSEIMRCRQTVKIVSEITGKKFQFDSRLNEYCNESFEEFVYRVQAFFDELTSSQDETFVICSHGAVIGAVKHLLMNESPTEDDLLDYPLTGELLTYKNARFETHSFNE
jgi:broad specificity phosphatase PhoE